MLSIYCKLENNELVQTESLGKNSQYQLLYNINGGTQETFFMNVLNEKTNLFVNLKYNNLLIKGMFFARIIYYNLLKEKADIDLEITKLELERFEVDSRLRHGCRRVKP